MMLRSLTISISLLLKNPTQPEFSNFTVENTRGHESVVGSRRKPALSQFLTERRENWATYYHCVAIVGSAATFLG